MGLRVYAIGNPFGLDPALTSRIKSLGIDTHGPPAAVGQRVYAIGNPFGLDHTLTSGIISGLNRELASGSGAGPSLRNMVQVRCAVL